MNAPSPYGQATRFDRLRLLALLLSHGFRIHFPKMAIGILCILLVILIASQVNQKSEQTESNASTLLDSALQDLLLQSTHLRLVDPGKPTKTQEQLKVIGFESSADIFRLLDARLTLIESLTEPSIPDSWPAQLRKEFKQLQSHIESKQKTEVERQLALQSWFGLLVPMINLNKSKVQAREQQLIDSANTVQNIALTSVLFGIFALLYLRTGKHPLVALGDSPSSDLGKTLPSRHVDHLTGLFNRAGWFHHCAALLHRASEAERSNMTLAVVSIDNFQEFSETYSSKETEGRICEAAQILRMNIRPGDLLARLGAGDFCLLLRNCSYQQATVSLDRIKNRAMGRIALSMGYTRAEGNAPLTLLMLKADQALYKSRQNRQIEYKKAPEIPELFKNQA